MKMIPKYWRQNKILTTPQGKAGGGMCRREIIVAGEVLGVSQCLDSAAGGDAVKLVNPVEMGISSAGGARHSRGAVGVCPCEQCHAAVAPHTSMLYTPSKTHPRRCLIQYDETDLRSNKHREIGKRAQQLICSLLLLRLRGFRLKRERVFTGVQWCKCR